MALERSVERMDDDIDAITCARVVDCAMMRIRAPYEYSVGVGMGLHGLTEREPIHIVIQ